MHVQDRDRARGLEARRRHLHSRLPAKCHGLWPFTDATNRSGRQQSAGLGHVLRRNPHPIRWISLAAIDSLPGHRPGVRGICQAPKQPSTIKAVNVGGNRENYQVRDVGDQVQRLMPAAKVVYTGEVGADPRNYRVNFDKLSGSCPTSSSSTTWSAGWRNFIVRWWSTVLANETLRAISSSGFAPSKVALTSSVNPNARNR